MNGSKHNRFIKALEQDKGEEFYLLDRKPKELEYFTHCGALVYMAQGAYRYVDSHKVLPFELTDNSLLTFCDSVTDDD